jgi:hypothetical protein
VRFFANPIHAISHVAASPESAILLMLMLL